MKKPFFSVRIHDKLILSVLAYDNPDEGPVRPINFVMPGTELIDTPFAGTFTREGRTPTEAAYWIDDAVIWIDSATIDTLRQEKSNEIMAACRDHIESGFLCPALGSDHLYPAKAQDQANLIGSITDSLIFADDPDWFTPFWCADELGVWEFRLHTRAQIQQVGRAGKVSILQSMQKNEMLQRQIAVADIATLQTITWSAE